MSMIDDTVTELRGAIAKSHEALMRELSRLRTGRANAALLDGVRIDYYGTPTPISQVANIAVPEPRMLTVKPWDKGVVKQVEKAILDANLGFNPRSDGDLIRIPMPALTEERRKELVKIAKKFGEECKVSIRKARHEAKDMLSSIEDEGGASQDEVSRAEKLVEDVIKAGTDEADKIVSRKEKDILEV